MNVMRSTLMSIVVALCAAASIQSVAAATLEVAPVVHELAPGRTSLAATVTNRGTSTVTLQVRGFAWSQHDGEDRLTSAPELMVAPAIFELPAGRSQVVRAAVRVQPAQVEQSYRLIVDELPSAEGVHDQVRMALRISMPVFILPIAPSAARIEWRVEPQTHSLVATNLGGSRERVRDLVVVGRDGQRVQAATPSGPYLLAGAERRWSLAELGGSLKSGDSISLTALTDAGRIEVPHVAVP